MRRPGMIGLALGLAAAGALVVDGAGPEGMDPARPYTAIRRREPIPPRKEAEATAPDEGTITRQRRRKQERAAGKKAAAEAKISNKRML